MPLGDIRLSSSVQPIAGTRKWRRADAICFAFFLAAPFPLLLKLYQSLWERPQYQFFPLMLVGAIVIAMERLQDVPSSTLRSGRRSITVLLLGLAYLCVIAGDLLYLRSLAEVALVLTLAGFAWWWGGWRLLKACIPALVLLCVLIPPPGHADETLTLRMQNWAVSASSFLLGVLHVPHLQAGNTLDIPGRRLLVEQACSGINSLLSILAFCLLFAFLKRRPLWWIALLLPLAAAFVLIANVLRITIEAWLKVRCGIDVLEGAAHETLGIVLFLVCAALVVLADAMLAISVKLRRRVKAARQIHPAAPAPPTHIPRAPDTGPRVPRPGLFSWIAASLFAVTAIAGQLRVGPAWPSEPLGNSVQFDLPSTIGAWQRVTTSPLTAERPQTIAAISRVWLYRRGDLLASVALDYPFRGYHELTTCYALGGWTMVSESSNVESPPTPGRNFQRVLMTKHGDENGYLLFSVLSADGQWLPQTPIPLKTFADTLRFVRHEALAPPTYQVQLLIQSPGPLTAGDQQQANHLFFTARQQLAAQILSHLHAIQ